MEYLEMHKFIKEKVNIIVLSSLHLLIELAIKSTDDEMWTYECVKNENIS